LLPLDLLVEGVHVGGASLLHCKYQGGEHARSFRRNTVRGRVTDGGQLVLDLGNGTESTSGGVLELQ